MRPTTATLVDDYVRIDVRPSFQLVVSPPLTVRESNRGD